MWLFSACLADIRSGGPLLIVENFDCFFSVLRLVYIYICHDHSQWPAYCDSPFWKSRRAGKINLLKWNAMFKNWNELITILAWWCKATRNISSLGLQEACSRLVFCLFGWKFLFVAFSLCAFIVNVGHGVPLSSLCTSQLLNPRLYCLLSASGTASATVFLVIIVFVLMPNILLVSQNLPFSFCCNNLWPSASLYMYPFTTWEYHVHYFAIICSSCSLLPHSVIPIPLFFCSSNLLATWAC